MSGCYYFFFIINYEFLYFSSVKELFHLCPWSSSTIELWFKIMNSWIFKACACILNSSFSTHARYFNFSLINENHSNRMFHYIPRPPCFNGKTFKRWLPVGGNGSPLNLSPGSMQVLLGSAPRMQAVLHREWNGEDSFKGQMIKGSVAVFLCLSNSSLSSTPASRHHDWNGQIHQIKTQDTQTKLDV